MIVRFDSLDHFEKPQLVLCNPGSVYNNGLLTKTIGVLPDCEAEENVLNFNAPSELNFRINRVPKEDPEENKYSFEMFKAVQNRRMVFVDSIGYFIITEVKNGFDGHHDFKDVKAQSVEIELQQKKVPYIEDGTYPFVTDEHYQQPIDNNSPLHRVNEGVMEKIVQSLPLWRLAPVPLAVGRRWRTFEDVDPDMNCLSFLIDKVQEAYECIILFDVANRIIYVYDQANYVHDTDIHITKDDLIRSLSVNEDANDLYTALTALGEDDLTIAAVNPLGTNTVYDFSYYLEWMSPELQEAVIAWQEMVEHYADPSNEHGYYRISYHYFNKLAEQTNAKAEVDRLNIIISMYRECYENITAENSAILVAAYNAQFAKYDAVELPPELEDIRELKSIIEQCIQDYFDQLMLQTQILNEITVDLETLRDQLNAITSACNPVNYFGVDNQGVDLYSELCNYIFEGSFKDEYTLITDLMDYREQFEQMETLYNRTKERLAKISKPTQQFDVDTESFIFAKRFANFTEQLETGCLINVELDDDDVAPLFLTCITVNYDDHSTKLTFGNRFNRFDPKALFESVLGGISRSANTLSYIKDLVYPIKNGEFNAMREAIQTSRNLTLADVLASEGEEVHIDSAGYTGRRLLPDGTYDPRQVKIIGKAIVFTKDAWETCQTAIGEIALGEGETAYGVNAETIIGDIIIGSNLHIIGEDGRDLFTVVDGQISSALSDVDGRISQVQQTVDGLNVTVSEMADIDSITTSTGYTFDANGLTIRKAGEEMSNVIDNVGMRIQRDNETILSADNIGVQALNLLSRQYLIVGDHSRFENYSNGTDGGRTACFYLD